MSRLPYSSFITSNVDPGIAPRNNDIKVWFDYVSESRVGEIES